MVYLGRNTLCPASDIPVEPNENSTDMRPELIDILACPECGGELSLSRPVANKEAEIVSGQLVCACGIHYPIIDRIPRLLPRSLWGLVRSRHPEAFSENSPTDSSEFDDQQIQTATSFGTQWEYFSFETDEQWKRDFLIYIDPVTENNLQGIQVLDAGCGMGRHARQAARCGARVVAMDLGIHVEEAIRHIGDAGTVDILQGDIFSPPFRPGTFDQVYSFGVLHHTPDPEKGVRSLSMTLKPEGRLSVWVYGTKKGWHPWHYLRPLARILPFFLLRSACWLSSAILWILFVQPGRFLSWISPEKLGPRTKFRFYQARPFTVLWTDYYDFLAAPLYTTHTEPEVRQWIQNAELLQPLTSQPDQLGGWRATGLAARSPKTPTT